MYTRYHEEVGRWEDAIKRCKEGGGYCRGTGIRAMYGEGNQIQRSITITTAINPFMTFARFEHPLLLIYKSIQGRIHIPVRIYIQGRLISTRN